MRTEIQNELTRLEQKHHIKILYAVESGSRAWGFASTNSDWDVRYIYIHDLDWYLKIDDKKDSQGEILENDIDLAGWELKKALRLFRKSNPPMLEWLGSPIVYSENYTTAQQLRELAKQFFNPRSCLHHYLHMAESNYRAYLQSDLVRTKKYFYVLRPVLACDWIMNTNTMPPTEFHKLVEAQVKDERINREIQDLLTRKMSGEELTEAPKIEVLNEYLNTKIEFYNQYIKQSEKHNPPETALLDKLFKDTLYEAWG